MEPYASAYNGVKYSFANHFTKLGYTVLDVLPDLKGKPFDDVALGYIHSLRPSDIRVSTGTTCLDAHKWRVTVYLNEETKLINNIVQEVEVALPE